METGQITSNIVTIIKGPQDALHLGDFYFGVKL